MDDWILTAPLPGWLSGLIAVPDPVFSTGMMGDGLAIDPIDGVLHAPCPATIVAIHAARHAITLRADAGFELLMHIGIDTVAQLGEGFTVLVTEGERVARGAPLIRFDLDALVRVVPAIVTPLVLTDSEGFALTDFVGDRLVAVGEPIGRIVSRKASLGNDSRMKAKADDEAIVSRDVAVMLAHGIHARPAARIVAAARAQSAHGEIIYNDRRAPLVSLVALMGLGLGGPGRVHVETSGPEGQALLDAVAAILMEEEASDHPVSVRTTQGATGAWGDPVGVPAAPGMVIGSACWRRATVLEFDPVGVGIETERARLDKAFDIVAAELDRQAAQPGSRGAVLGAHRALLDDPDLRISAISAIAAGRSAPAAIEQAILAQAATLRSTGDNRITERVDDLEDIARRLISAALGRTEARSALPKNAILLADELLPSQLIALEGEPLVGICLKGGGPTSHVAILAAGMGVPMLVAAGEAIDAIANGATLILDADQGTLAIDPDPAMRAAAEAELAARTCLEARDDAAARAGRTADGIAVPVMANIGALADAHAAAGRGAEGCGLLRTEFLFLDRAAPPDADEQLADYQAIADVLGDRPLVIRLLDVGGDKPAAYLKILSEENPALGLRGIRVGLARPEILEAQLRAILAVRPVGRCRIMVPMVSDLGELAAVRAMLDRLAKETGVEPPPLGIMVETPAAAIAADLLAREADFLSIGSNDLTQYTLAMDRGNPAVAGGIDGLHPAVLRLIDATCTGAARYGRPVSLCGGLAAEALAVPILIGLGVRALSVPPARIGTIRGLLARMTLGACQTHARAALDQTGAQPVRALARAFAREYLA